MKERTNNVLNELREKLEIEDERRFESERKIERDADRDLSH